MYPIPDGSDAVRKDTRAVTVFLGSVVAGNCLFDNPATGVLFMRSPTVIVTYHSQPTFL